MSLIDWLKRPFDRATFIPDRSDYVARLHSAAPTVTPEELARLERKWKQQPVDFEEYAGPIG